MKEYCWHTLSDRCHKQTNVQIRVLWAKTKIELYVNMHPLTLRLFHYDHLVLHVVHMQITHILDNRPVVLG
jgi:hypothetical protein